MTRAASMLHLTQSGVSQHLKSMEAQLGVTLFDRIHHKLLATENSERLYPKVKQALELLEGALSPQAQDTLQGNLRVGMPVEFAYHFGIPRVSQFLKKHPQVLLELRLGYAVAMRSALLNDLLDLAFLDNVSEDPKLDQHIVYRETLELCASFDYLKGKHIDLKSLSASDFQKFDYLEYEEGAPFIQKWIQKNLSKRVREFQVRARVQDAQAILTLIENHMGVGVLPGHLYKKEKSKGKITSFSDLFKKPSMAFNEIVAVKVSGRTLRKAPERLWQDFTGE